MSLFLTTILLCISQVHKDVPKVLAALERLPPSQPHRIRQDSSHSLLASYGSSEDHLHHPTLLTLLPRDPKGPSEAHHHFHYLRNTPHFALPQRTSHTTLGCKDRGREGVCDPFYSFPNGICHLESETRFPKSFVAKMGGQTAHTLSERCTTPSYSLDGTSHFPHG